jgi:uncharacterized protein
MSQSQDGLNRRKFLTAVGAAGLCPILASSVSAAADDPPPTPAKAVEPGKVAGQVPRRKLGKTGVEISVVGMGGTYNVEKTPDVLPRALELGITYWDSSISYGGSEQGIGAYLAKNPGVRPKLFLVTKTADIATPMPVIPDVERQFQESLKRLHTDYLDMYCGIHAMPDAKQLTDDLRKWAEEKKKKGQIKFFGFSTHSSQGRNLLAASKLDWIDACLVRADFRVIREKEMNEGLDACAKAGIGIISIKAMSVGLNPNSAEDKKLSHNFTDKGFDAYQAKLKALLEDSRFTAASVGMKTVPIAESCAAAAMDKTSLTAAHWQALDRYAQATCSNFCAGCAHICGQAVPNQTAVADLMRFVMYHNSYGQREGARALFAEMPEGVRRGLQEADYSLAEARCPQHIPIGAMVTEAFRVLA